MTLHPRHAEIYKKLTPEQTVAMTIRAEAGAEVIEGKIAVGCVIRHRFLAPNRFQEGWKAVCLTRWQFSCWIPEGGVKNYMALMALCADCLDGVRPWPEQYIWLASGIISGACPDRVGGANHYYASWMPKPPRWADNTKLTTVIGVHRFYKL